MFEIFCITNRKLCQEDFLLRLKEIAAERPTAILLREKDLPEAEYAILAEKAVALCNQYGTKCILHSRIDLARELKTSVHLPLSILRERKQAEISVPYGSSCHSLEEAREAEERGCRYLIAGHIFETNCKRGLPGRGLEFLHEIVRNVKIPVYAIGGITLKNAKEVLALGVKGICTMSGFMTCPDVHAYFSALKELS